MNQTLTQSQRTSLDKMNYFICKAKRNSDNRYNEDGIACCSLDETAKTLFDKKRTITWKVQIITFYGFQALRTTS